MQSIQEDIIVDLILQNTKNIQFVKGLGGFEEIKDFILSIDPIEAPFLWLTAQNYQNVAFLAVDPFLIYPDYQPEFLDADLEILDIQQAEDMLVLCIANLTHKNAEKMTINLKAPLLINWMNGFCQQCIVKNEEYYSMTQNLFPKISNRGQLRIRIINSPYVK
jgi:flagellar assembly factor FliW